eukprot:gene15931-16097_t
MHRARMDAAQRHGHPPHFHRQRIVRHEHPAIGQLHIGAFVQPQRLQPLRLFGHERVPIDSRDTRWRAERNLVKRHHAGAGPLNTA